MARARSIGLHLVAAAGLGVAIWLLLGRTAFVNYDSAWSLNWMRELLAESRRPDLERLFSPTPHPLSDAFSGLLVPLSDAGSGAVGRGAETALVVSALFWLGALGVVTFRLGAAWFGTAAGVVAAVLVLTREPVLSYGLRTYLDLPYAVFLLLALLAETRRPRNGVATLAWITLAGLLRPEAWLLAGAYVTYLLVHEVRTASPPSAEPGGRDERHEDGRYAAKPAADPVRDALLAPTPRERVAGWLARLDRRRTALLLALAAVAPLGWLVEGLVLAGDPLQALTGTQQNAADLDRVTGLGSAVTVMPRRLGEIVREPVLLAAAGGALLSLAFLRRRALLGAAAGVAAAVAFFVLAAAGLPLLTRYLVFPGTILILFAAAGLLGWRRLEADHPWRRRWQAFATVCVVAFVAFTPSQVDRVDRLQDALALQQRVIGDLRTVTGEVLRPVLALDRCAPTSGPDVGTSTRAGAGLPVDVALPNHRAVPQVLLWLGDPVRTPTSDDDGRPSVASRVDGRAATVTLLPADERVARGFILDRADRGRGLPAPPAGARLAGVLGSWRVYGREPRCTALLRERLAALR
ncbi:hypothetical protein SK069_05980 [Patulibacter brassicae]|jgi:hypothetical protein|uniref:Glycosyltransferase RgtA/B/C/D-like domain-containing protein n=1 Tax=Patulibacter brassicae TaxID=1705717 RepID=A0ABU4VH37_9ACTN|nr:hypothetical protein [Patulibacter brassicae]MDX8151132.1 hypothetical protein [Patulibacter brassicae]